MSAPVTLKYIRHSVAGFIVWPLQLECLAHRDIAKAIQFTREPVVAEGEILSAGFIQFNGGNHKPFCYGRSDSLNVESRSDDTKALRAEWGMQLGQADQNHKHEHGIEHGTVTGSPL